MNTKKKRYRINKFRMFSTLLIVAVVIFISVMGIHGFISNAEEIYYGGSCTDYKMIEVAEGDSLWSIARSCNTKGVDLRKTVETICDINMLENCMIHPGEILMIPNV